MAWEPTARPNSVVILADNFGVGDTYRDGPWKLVWRMSKPNLEQSRGQPTVPELYHLGSDVGEQTELSGPANDRNKE
jgi:hypothetical protein